MILGLTPSARLEIPQRERELRHAVRFLYTDKIFCELERPWPVTPRRLDLERLLKQELVLRIEGQCVAIEFCGFGCIVLRSGETPGEIATDERMRTLEGLRIGPLDRLRPGASGRDEHPCGQKWNDQDKPATASTHSDDPLRVAQHDVERD
jgi:hypothetical protein